MAEYYCDFCTQYTVCESNPRGEVLRCTECGKVLVRMMGLAETEGLEVLEPRR